MRVQKYPMKEKQRKRKERGEEISIDIDLSEYPPPPPPKKNKTKQNKHKINRNWMRKCLLRVEMHTCHLKADLTLEPGKMGTRLKRRVFRDKIFSYSGINSMLFAIKLATMTQVWNDNKSFSRKKSIHSYTWFLLQYSIPCSKLVEKGNKQTVQKSIDNYLHPISIH